MRAKRRARPSARPRAAVKSTKPVETVVMSGGAPHSPLMAGFLCALLEHGRMFRNFHTSGAGALMALLTIAPKGTTPEKALRRWAEVGVADEIYRWLPVNFKVFSKPGPFAPVFHRWASRFKVGEDPPVGNTPEDRRQQAYREFTDTFLGTSDPDGRRLFNDAVDLWFSTLTPSTLNYWSQGLAAPLPFLEDVVDFDKFKDQVRRGTFDGLLLVNAFCVTDEKTRIFANKSIDARHVRAALSLPFLYPPGKIGSKYYVEGAAVDPLNFEGLRKKLDVDFSGDPEPVIVLDIMGSHPEWMIREPKNLWDAYIISIVTPIVALAKKDLRLFELRHNRNPRTGEKLFAVERIGFHIPKGRYPKVLDWSYSNLQYMFDAGYEAGEDFAGTALGKRVPRRRDVLRR